jgi:hypothetical protein
MITIPSSSQDSFTQLLNTKMQAQWAQRQSVILEGVSVTLPPRHDGTWTFCLGDLRNVGSAAGKVTSGSGANTMRAMILEIEYQEDNDDGGHSKEGINTEETMKKYENLLRGMAKSLFRSATDLKFEDARLAVKQIPATHMIEKEKSDNKAQPAGWELASLYMEVLRGTKS